MNLQLPHVLLGGLSLALVAFVATSPALLGDQVRDGLAGLNDASPVWLWLAAFCFVASLASSGWAWRTVLLVCGGSLGYSDAAARYGVGCLVNSLAPAKIGTAVRIGLYATTLRGEGRLWTAGGVGTAVAAAQVFWLALLCAIAAAAGVLPAQPLLVLLGLLIAAAATAYVARRWRSTRRIAHALDAFRALGTSPRCVGALLAHTGLAMTGRLAAGAALAVAFGLDNPIAVAFLIVPAVELASFLPLTPPGNLGVTSAAVAFALRSKGIDGDLALATGIAFNAVEALASLAFGSAGALYVAGAQTGVRRWTTALVGATACAALAGAFGWTVLVPLA